MSNNGTASLHTQTVTLSYEESELLAKAMVFLAEYAELSDEVISLATQTSINFATSGMAEEDAKREEFGDETWVKMIRDYEEQNPPLEDFSLRNQAETF